MVDKIFVVVIMPFLTALYFGRRHVRTGVAVFFGLSGLMMSVYFFSGHVGDLSNAGQEKIGIAVLISVALAALALVVAIIVIVIQSVIHGPDPSLAGLCDHCGKIYRASTSDSRIAGLYCSRNCELAAGISGISFLLFVFGFFAFTGAILALIVFLQGFSDGFTKPGQFRGDFLTLVLEVGLTSGVVAIGIGLRRRRAWARHSVLLFSAAAIALLGYVGSRDLVVFRWLALILLPFPLWFLWVLWNGAARAAFNQAPEQNPMPSN